MHIYIASALASYLACSYTIVVCDEILKAEGGKKTPWNVPEVARIRDKELW